MDRVRVTALESVAPITLIRSSAVPSVDLELTTHTSALADRDPGDARELCSASGPTGV